MDTKHAHRMFLSKPEKLNVYLEIEKKTRKLRGSNVNGAGGFPLTSTGCQPNGYEMVIIFVRARTQNVIQAIWRMPW